MSSMIVKSATVGIRRAADGVNIAYYVTPAY